MNILEQYSQNQKLSILIRHGDRDQIPEGSFGNEIMLNEKGKKNALDFGKSISEMKVNKILTSPVCRCVQTAEEIVKGYGSSIEIIETKALGGPGLHINDTKMAGEFYLKYGFDEMYYRFINDMEIPGVLSATEFNKLFTDHLVENTTKNGLTIFVSHDMLIAFYHFSIDKTVYKKENWIKYLSGLILKDGRYER